jgi:hypothetical protein
MCSNNHALSQICLNAAPNGTIVQTTRNTHVLEKLPDKLGSVMVKCQYSGNGNQVRVFSGEGITVVRGKAVPLLNYEGVSRRFRAGRLGRELQMVQLSATKSSCVAIL